MSRDQDGAVRRVGILGWGAIGQAVGHALLNGEVATARLVAIANRSTVQSPPVNVVPIDELSDRCDLVVECAGQEAVRFHGKGLLGGGCDLLITSIGALADHDLRQTLHAQSGRLLLTTGAIGGLDILAAASRDAAFDRVTLTTTKAAPTLIQDWTESGDAERLRSGTPGIVCFDGSAAEAATMFPASVNVAAALAEAVGDWNLVRVRVVSGPVGSPNQHVIEAEGPVGWYRFEIVNRPSTDNPRTSRVVAAAVLRSISLLRPESGSVL